MATLTLRKDQAIPLTNLEMDTNLENLNNQLPKSLSYASGTLTLTKEDDNELTADIGNSTFSVTDITGGKRVTLNDHAGDDTNFDLKGGTNISLNRSGNVITINNESFSLFTRIELNAPSNSNALEVSNGGRLNLFSGTSYVYDNYIQGRETENDLIWNLLGDGIKVYDLWGDTVTHDWNRAGNYTTTGSITSAGLHIDSTGAVEMPTGTNTQRPTGVAGMLRFNTDEGSFEGYDGTEWGAIGGGGALVEDPAGTFTLTGDLIVTGDVTSQSDERVKENFEQIDSPLAKVEALNGLFYNRIGETERKLGMIAQQVEQVVPEVIQENSEGLLSIAYANMVALLVEAVKELSAEVKELKNINSK